MHFDYSSLFGYTRVKTLEIRKKCEDCKSLIFREYFISRLKGSVFIREYKNSRE